LAAIRFKKAKLAIELEEAKTRPSSFTPNDPILREIDQTSTSKSIIPNTNSHNITIGHNINMGGPSPPSSSSSSSSSDIDESRAIKALLARICDYPATQAIATTLHASSKQKEDARKGKFVPLANFLPSQFARTSVPLEAQSASKAFADAIESLTEEGLANNIAKLNAKTPKFKEFGDVIMAFAGGLIPIACADRPERFADYTSFLMEILLQHATGRQHWPVILHDIESIRRTRQPTGDGAAMDRTRDTHKLCDHPLPSTRSTSIMDPLALAASSNMFNDTGLRSTFVQDFIDHQVLQSIGKATLPEAERINKLYSTHNSNTQTQGPNTTGAKRYDGSRLSPDDITLAKQHNACIKFLHGTCTDPCPANRAHESITLLRSRSRSSPTHTTPTHTYTTKKEGTGD
jgi:hypothetical protein